MICFYFKIFVYINCFLISSLTAKDQLSNQENHLNSVLKKRFNNSFQVGVFDLYHSQMKSFLSTVEGKQDQSLTKLNKLISLINGDFESVELKKQFHENMLLLLRDLIQEKKNDREKETEFIDTLCKWMYTAPNLLPAYAQFLKKTISFDSQSLNEKNFVELIKEIQHSLEKNPHFNGHLALDKPIIDLHYEGYLPSYLFTAFSTPFAITSRVTIENQVGPSITINPEFYNYLHSLKQANQTHLYINLMSRGGPQRDLTKTIEDTSLKLDDVFYVVSLDKTFDFYWQRNRFQENTIQSDAFKNMFLHEMFDRSEEESKYKWPIQLNLSTWRESCSKLLNDVHQDYFDSKEFLAHQERLDFIELSYLKMVQALCLHLKPTYATMSCKSSVDRAPSLLSLLFIYDCIENKKQFSVDDREKALAIFFAPPLLSHNRHSHDYRVNRLTSALNVLQKKYANLHN